VSRGTPFCANLLLARSLSPAQFGLRSVHFELASALVLTCRDAFRRACPRAASADAAAAAWLAPAAGAIVALALAGACRLALGGGADGQPYRMAVYGYAAAAALELAAEPLHLAAQRAGALRLRLAAEGASTWVRAGCCAALLARERSSLPLELRFAAAQLAGSVALLAVYCVGACAVAGAAAAPGPLPALRGPRGLAQLLRSPLARLLAEFSAQAYWKVLLAEGDKLALLAAGAAARGGEATAAAAADAAGVYSLAAGLGGLVARMLLQPLEEACFGAFAARAAAGARAGAALLSALLRALLLAALLAAAAGPPCAAAALRLLYGGRWAAAAGGPATLAAFALYVPLLALNGLLEAFAAAHMSPAQVRAANVVLLSAAALAATVAAAAARALGPVALVAGNGAGMALRIAAAARFAAASGGGGGGAAGVLRAAAPRARTAVALVATSAALFASQARMNAAAAAAGELSAVVAAAHLARAAATAAALLPLLVLGERDALRGALAALGRS
jgi:hypothetical protein